MKVRPGFNLFIATYEDRLEIVQTLIAAKADVNKADDEGYTPLYKSTRPTSQDHSR